MDPNFPYTKTSPQQEWSSFHHIIKGRHIEHYMVPDVPAGDPEADRHLAEAINAILRHCMDKPFERRLCTLGSRWSLSDILDPREYTLEPSAWNQVIPVAPGCFTEQYKDRAKRSHGTPVIAQAGIIINKLNNDLGRMGLAVQTSGASSGHRLAGCIATGSHGSDLKVGAVHDMVLAMYLVVGPNHAVLLQPSTPHFTSKLAESFEKHTGLHTEHHNDDHLFGAAQVALGALGFVHSVIIEAVPLYDLQGETIVAPLDDKAIWHAIDTMELDHLPLRHRPVPHTPPDVFTVVLSPYAPRSLHGAFATLLWKQPTKRPFASANPVQPSISTDLARLLSGLIRLGDGRLTQGLVGHTIAGETAKMYQPGPIHPQFPGTYFGPTDLAEGHGRSSEVAVDQKHAGAALRAVVLALQEEGKHGRHLLGGIGVRFVPQTRALLGMNIHPMNTYIEFPSLDYPDKSKVSEIHEAVWKKLHEAKVPFTCHWGQEYAGHAHGSVDGMNEHSIRTFYGDRVHQWKAARNALLKGPALEVFSNPLVQKLGLA
jgi:hypothetical protein